MAKRIVPAYVARKDMVLLSGEFSMSIEGCIVYAYNDLLCVYYYHRCEDLEFYWYMHDIRPTMCCTSKYGSVVSIAVLKKICSINNNL